MGTWGTGPFDSDSAGDFIDAVGAADSDGATTLVRAALENVADGREQPHGSEAVAAAAMVAIQLPGGDAYTDDEDELPTLPPFPVELRALAVAALDVVLRGDCDVSKFWVTPDYEAEWRAAVVGIRAVLAAEA